jgi:arylsulfatase A-like enzyme
VLFIICDDLSTVVYHPKGKPIALSPNIDAFRQQAVTFTHAYANDPICAPSRASLMSGIMPHRSNLTWFESWRDNQMLRTSIHLLPYLRSNGYRVYGTGKLYHNGQEHDAAYDTYGTKANFGPFPQKPGGGLAPHPDMRYLFDTLDIPHAWEQTFGRLSNTPVWDSATEAYRGWQLGGQPFYYASATDRDLLPDEQYAAFAQDVLEQEHEEPFFLGVGFCRPHTPLYVPDNYFDLFPLDSITLPSTVPNDLEDCAPALTDSSLYGFRRYQFLQQDQHNPLLKKWIQAYLASVAFVDEQIGQVLTALANSPYADNTLVIITSDHGFHMGEKEFLYKQSVWSESTRIPLMISWPGVASAGTVCDQPVSLIDIYPTLIEAGRLPPHPNKGGNEQPLDGHSMVELLKNPAANAWAGPEYVLTVLPGEDHTTADTLTTKPPPHWALSTRDWRYVQTAQGQEELYNVRVDPHEWHNQAHAPAALPTLTKFRNIVAQEKQQVPVNLTH